VTRSQARIQIRSCDAVSKTLTVLASAILGDRTGQLTGGLTVWRRASTVVNALLSLWDLSTIGGFRIRIPCCSNRRSLHVTVLTLLVPFPRRRFLAPGLVQSPTRMRTNGRRRSIRKQQRNKPCKSLVRIASRTRRRSIERPRFASGRFQVYALLGF
jgi:hypothetical protein